MEKLEEGNRGSVWPKNKLEGQRESVLDGSRTSNDVLCRDMGSEESIVG